MKSMENLYSHDWEKYLHAYGAATDIPGIIKSLYSPDPDERDAAIGDLFSTIYHQGTLYSSTSISIPFLIEIALDNNAQDRDRILDLLYAIIESAIIDPETIYEHWRLRGKNYGEVYDLSTREKAENQVQANEMALAVALNSSDKFEALLSDENEKVASLAAAILNSLKSNHPA